MRAVDHASEDASPRWGCFAELDHSDEHRLIVELCEEAGFDPLKCSLESEYQRTYDGDVAVIRILLPTEHCAYCNERRARKNGEFPDALRAPR